MSDSKNTKELTEEEVQKLLNSDPENERKDIVIKRLQERHIKILKNLNLNEVLFFQSASPSDEIYKSIKNIEEFNYNASALIDHGIIEAANSQWYWSLNYFSLSYLEYLLSHEEPTLMIQPAASLFCTTKKPK